MMDLQTLLSNAVTAGREERMKTSDQMTLGELIARLEGLPMKYEWNNDPAGADREVYLDFASCFPTELSAWRGSYSELAIEFSCGRSSCRHDGAMSLEAFVTLLKDAIGKSFEGYKGGESVMGKRTPLWVAQWGDSGDTAVVGVDTSSDYKVTIKTASREY